MNTYSHNAFLKNKIRRDGEVCLNSVQIDLLGGLTERKVSIFLKRTDVAMYLQRGHFYRALHFVVKIPLTYKTAFLILHPTKRKVLSKPIKHFRPFLIAMPNGRVFSSIAFLIWCGAVCLSSLYVRNKHSLHPTTNIDTTPHILQSLFY